MDNEGTALFINRAYKELVIFKKENNLKDENLEYINYCVTYMKRVSDHLLDEENKNDFVNELLAELNFEKLMS